MKPSDANVDVFDNGDEYFFEFELHGLPRDEFHVSRHGDALYLTGVRTTPNQTENECQAGRPRGAFVHRLTLPPDSRLNEIRANFHDGTLQVHVPKKTRDGNEKSAAAELADPNVNAPSGLQAEPILKDQRQRV